MTMHDVYKHEEYTLPNQFARLEGSVGGVNRRTAKYRGVQVNPRLYDML